MTTVAQHHRGPTGRDFDGITIHAARGVHERGLALIAQLVQPRARIADLGAGSGAFSARLADAGYTPIAVDLEIAEPLHGIETLEADLCRSLSDALGARSVDAAVALEVIEHLEDPLEFLRQVRAAIRPGGTLILSTPNVLHPYSRIKFLVKGTYWLFDERDYWRTGHVTPLPQWLLRGHLEHAGFVDIHHGFAGSFEFHGGRRLAVAALSAIPRRTRPLLGAHDDCSTLFITARAPA